MLLFYALLKRKVVQVLHPCQRPSLNEIPEKHEQYPCAVCVFIYFIDSRRWEISTLKIYDSFHGEPSQLEHFQT